MATMELSLQTFLWLRDKGGLSSQCGTPSSLNGMIVITAEGLQEITSGLPVVKVLHKYCCHRFEAPDSLRPLIPTIGSSTTTTAGDAHHQKQHISVEAARHHNWNVVRAIVSQALGHDLPADQIVCIQKHADTLEALLVVKCIYDLVRRHRDQEQKQVKEQKRVLLVDPVPSQVKKLLQEKSVAASKEVGPAVHSSGTSPTRQPHAGPKPQWR